MSPMKLLEINLVSAQDLPPVSKMLRTFAVAYVSPEHKLTTKVDHKGHTNPHWNYKMFFHVDKHFLKQESSILTIEIYNLAWLRDLPIGTARLHFNTISPPLTQTNGYRKISLQICRPSGHLQGTVSLNVQLVDMEDDVSLSSLRISDEESVAEEKKEEKSQEPEDNPGPEENPSPEEKSGQEIKSTNESESVCSTPETKYTWQLESEPETRTVTSGGSDYSCMRPLPSEVASDLKKGFYKADTGEYGSSIFENWTEGGDRSDDLGRKTESSEGWDRSDDLGTKTESIEEWESERQLVPLMSELPIDTRRRLPEKKIAPVKNNAPVKNKGLFKCLSNIYAFEFTFVCGSSQFKLKKKFRNANKVHRRAHSDGRLGKLYV